MNVYPSENEERALRDVAKHPESSLQERADRLGRAITRAGVQHLLSRCADKGFAFRKAGNWSLTLGGRSWLRPTMATRSAR